MPEFLVDRLPPVLRKCDFYSTTKTLRYFFHRPFDGKVVERYQGVVVVPAAEGTGTALFYGCP